MEKIDARKLTPKEQFEIRKRVIKLREKGYGNKETAAILELSQYHTSRLWQSYLKDGIKGIGLKRRGRPYGMVIVDECHHVSAFSFEQILKTMKAKYVYGLTATPKRHDGHHPIINMQCGEIRYHVDEKSEAAKRPFEHFVIPRFTRFQIPIHQDECARTIADLYRDIQNSEIRNQLITHDVALAVKQGRNPIILTERTEHVNILAEMLRTHVSKVVLMTGGLGRKKNRELLQTISEIPLDESFVLIATGKYVGEGFDMPRLDTLFLAMPISWSGTVQQYSGRLHRLFDGKHEVQIYDYVDIKVPMLERMYQKRLKSYATIGYKAKGTPQQIEPVNSIFDNVTFAPVFSTDILGARREVLIVSPFLTKQRILASLNYLSATNTIITVVTRSSENCSEKDGARIGTCIALLKHHGVAVVTKTHLHQKFAIIDQRIIWYGSINLLGYGSESESIMRIENLDIASELAGVI